MTVDELMSSVELDFKRYSEAGLIDMDTIYQTIAYCNAQLGVQMSPIKYCVADIINSKVNLPENFQKIKSVHVISNFKVPSSLPFYNGWVEHTTEKPKAEDPTYTPMGCLTDNGQCYWVVPHKNTVEEHLIFTTRSELYLTESSYLKESEYSIDKDEELIEFGINSGKVFICYYEDPTNLQLVPKHPLLFPWWSWSVKAKILLDILMNSDDDVQVKLKIAEKERDLAFADVDAFIKSRSYKRSSKERINQEQEFYNTWFSNIM